MGKWVFVETFWIIGAGWSIGTGEYARAAACGILALGGTLNQILYTLRIEGVKK